MEKRLAIFLEGGIIHRMVTNVPDLDIVVIDQDTESFDEEDTTMVLGEEAFVTGWGKRNPYHDIVDPDLVDQIFKEIEENEKY